LTDVPTTPPFRARLRGPVFDCLDALELADFYSALLGWPIAEQVAGGGPESPGPSWAKIESPDGRSKIEFQGLWDYQRPVWPNVAGAQQQMLHLDIAVDSEAAVGWCLEHGATLAEHQPQPHVLVLLDPAGHPFCLFGGAV
jgi:hypothetical protein